MERKNVGFSMNTGVGVGEEVCGVGGGMIGGKGEHDSKKCQARAGLVMA